MSEAKRARLLVVEDDPGLRRQLKWSFDGCEVLLAEDRKTALSVQAEYAPAVALIDLGLPPDPDGPTEGLRTLEQLLEASPESKVIVMTGQTDRAYALQSVASGAYDYHAKPIDVDELGLTVKRAFRIHDLEAENRRLKREHHDEGIAGLNTCNAEMREVCSQVARFARANVGVLLMGESGTGKELLARGLHQKSGRSGELVAINCAAIPPELLESELFGHEKGAFTGAHQTKAGKIEQADKGTLFLDEIGDLSHALQAKLLRVLQERSVERVGGRRAIPVNFRIVSATNHDLPAMVEQGAFREDLYYRLGEVTLRLPPLRNRPEDLALIAQDYLEQWAAAEGLGDVRFSAEALASLTQYDWPGNVRELQSCVKRAALSCDGRIHAHHLGLGTGREAARETETLREARRKAELSALHAALAQAGGKMSEAARILDVSRPTLYQLLRDHNLKS